MPRTGPGDSSQEGDSVLTVVLRADVELKEQLVWCGIYRAGLPKQDSGNDIHSVITVACAISWRFDPMQFMSHIQQCLLAIGAKRHSQVCMCKVHCIQGRKETITKATSLSNGKSLVQRGQPYSTGQFTVTHG